MVFFNISGIVEAVVSYGIGVILFGETTGFLIAGIIWAGLDLGYRKLRQGEYEDYPLWAPKKGGQIMFIPGWICGIALFVLGLFGM